MKTQDLISTITIVLAALLVPSACQPSPSTTLVPTTGPTATVQFLPPTASPSLPVESTVPITTETTTADPTSAQSTGANREITSVPEPQGIETVTAVVASSDASIPIELDKIINAVLSADVNQQRGLLQFSKRPCTTADGLGGPPKCMEGEPPDTPVEVLPFLGPEGSFLRKADVNAWPGLSGLNLYAVYQVSDKVYSEPDYPAGDYAVVFITDPPSQTYVTLQVRNGFIVRIDTGFGNPVEIPAKNVLRFLISPRP